MPLHKPLTPMLIAAVLVSELTATPQFMQLPPEKLANVLLRLVIVVGAA